MFKQIPSTIITLKGVKFKSLNLNEQLKIAVIHLNRDKRFGYICSSCKKPATPNRRKRREIRDLAIFDKVSYL
jgi:hypothetical protein